MPFAVTIFMFLVISLQLNLQVEEKKWMDKGHSVKPGESRKEGGDKYGSVQADGSIGIVKFTTNLLKEDTMGSNIGNKAEKEFKEEMAKKKKAGAQIDKSKLEAEGTCEIISGKDEEEVCEIKT